jgi:2,3-bisphosphoglycerate-independent phosphoglycerate mutase
VIIINFANCDMVGHTGVETAAIKAVEAVDACVGRVVAKVQALGGALLITADHGNAEQMQDENGEPFTAHTTNPVWLVLVDENRKGALLREGGRLADVAPTMLKMLGLAQPQEMTGKSLF